MTKLRTLYSCSHCGAQFQRWQGRCSECQSWQTLEEERVGSAGAASVPAVPLAQARPLADIRPLALPRRSTRWPELDRVLGGGWVAGSAVLLGGEPGIGKSTLLLQVACAGVGEGEQPPLYVTGEESAEQIKLRAQRLGLGEAPLLLLAETDIATVLLRWQEHRPSLVVVDSIQVMREAELAAAPGSVSQVRAAAYRLIGAAKATGTPLVLIGHVTKDGTLAGPRVLEHLVDVVLSFEGEHYGVHRVLRGSKNRFGATGEIGVFEMRGDGLAEVREPSRLFLGTADAPREGAATVSLRLGSRSFLVQVQALIAGGAQGHAARKVSGVDSGRVAMILAVLERRCGLTLAGEDVFVNAVGGAQLGEPAADLGIALAIVGARRGQGPPAGTVCIAEVGLGGELRPVPHLRARLQEAARLRFPRAIIARADAEQVGTAPGLEVLARPTLSAALELLD